MYTLGINAAFHDSAACLVKDGVVLAAAEEERFTRIKHAKRPVPFSAWELPFAAIDYCLAAGGIDLAALDHVAYSFDPREFPGFPGDGAPLVLPGAADAQRGDARPDDGANPWDHLFVAAVLNAPGQLRDGAPHHLRARFRAPAGFEWHFVEHHRAHEASAFLAAPFDSAAVMTLDGRGERATTTFGVYRDSEFRRLRQVDVPHSLGLLYEDVTRYLGFLHSSDEYKVMALASYGEPRHLQAFRSIVQCGEGTYRLEACDLETRFGPRRHRGQPFERRHADLAASLQCVLEETALALAGWLRREAGEPRLCMAGGVALNCVMNARLRDAGLFDEIWVQPAAGDAGTALGAALWVDCAQRGGTRRWRMDHAYLGPGYSDAEIARALDWAHVPYQRVDDVAEATAGLLADGRVVGWFQGRMEFGPRALGARSILASPIDPAMQQRLNDLKDREDFRPVAPAILEEALPDWFANGAANGGTARFMLFVYDALPGKAARIPAAVHVDGTARVQTVDRESNPRYHALLRAFERRTGVPVLVNTSFNTRGDPIVCSPRDALESFFSTPLDALAIGSFVVRKAGR